MSGVRCRFKRNSPVYEYKEILQDMLRHRIVCGVNHEIITNRLLFVKKLTFDKGMELAQAIKSAERDTQQLHAAQSTSTTPQVHHSTAHKPKNRQTRESSRPAKQGNSVVFYRFGGPHLMERRMSQKSGIINDMR